MARLSDVGNGLGQSLDYKGLEPTGLPAYEGTGYPAAGFGQRRNRVVKFNPKRVGRLTRDPVNRYSDAYTRATVSVLGSLGSAGVDDYRGGDYRREALDVLRNVGDLRTDGSHLDRALLSNLKALAGLGSLGVDIPSVTQLTDMLVKGVVPQSLIDTVTRKVLADQKAVDQFYANVQKLKALPKAKQPADLAELAAKQEEAWSKLNTVKYYLLMLTDFQKSLGFTSGKRLVTPPDYNHIKRKAANAKPGFFEKTAQYIKDKVFRDTTADLLKKGYYTGTLDGVGLREDLGALGNPLFIAIAVVLGGVIIAYLGKSVVESDPARRAANLTLDVKEPQIVAAKVRLQKAKTPEEATSAKKELQALVTDVQGAGAAGNEASLSNIAKYAAYAVGGIVVIYALGLFTKKG